jgi:PKD repeat protein
MLRRSLSASLLVGVLLAGLLPLAASAAGTPPLPTSMAAVGDSITRAMSSGGTLAADYPANAWSTGTNATVNSHYARLLAFNPAISGRAWNDAVSGAKMADLNGQMSVAVAQQPDYLTVLVGGNDLCTDTVAQMTSVTDFRAQFVAAMQTLTAGSPDTLVFVASIPKVNQLWELFRSSFWARSVWSLGDICQSLLANPTSTTSTDVARRAQVAQRNIDFNVQLAQVCALYPQCRFDGNAVYNVAFVRSDVSGDYFHPSVAGQAKLAAVTWAASYWPSGGPVTDTPPTAAFTPSCTNLACSFNASASSDDNGIAAYAWTFGDGSTGSGVTASHTYATAGTYPVTIVVTDTAGQTASTSANVTVTAPPSTPKISLGSADGIYGTRKGGWTATVTVSAVSAGAPVEGALVSGTWSAGATGTGSCTTTASGSCAIVLNVGRKVTSVTWTVGSVTKAGYAYDATADVGSRVTIVVP